jgi:hypothetical protein
MKGSLGPSGREPEGNEKLVCLVSTPSCLVLASVHTSGYGRWGLAPYAKAWRAMAPLCWLWWHCGNVGMVVHQLPCMAWAHRGRRGLCTSVLFFGDKSWHHCTGRVVVHRGLPALLVTNLLPRPLLVDLIGAPDRDSHTVVGVVVRPSIRLDVIWTVLSHAGWRSQVLVLSFMSAQCYPRCDALP